MLYLCTNYGLFGPNCWFLQEGPDGFILDEDLNLGVKSTQSAKERGIQKARPKVGNFIKPNCTIKYTVHSSPCTVATLPNTQL